MSGKSPAAAGNMTRRLRSVLERELHEEVRAGVASVGDVVFCYKSMTRTGRPKLSITAKVTLDDSVLTPTDDDLIETRFVTKEEFLQLPFQRGEGTVQACVDKIWP
jgi:hypothetical protein